KARAIDPVQFIPNFEPCILNCARHAMMRPCSTKGQQMTPGLQDAKHFTPEIDVERNTSLIPRSTHEAKLIWWICDDRIDRVIGKLPKLLQRVSMNDLILWHITSPSRSPDASQT